MIREISKHIVHYLSLVGILLAAFVGFVTFEFNNAFQSAIAISLGVAFVVWGLVHHHIHDDLHPKIVLEYIAIAALGVTVLLSVV